MLGIAPGARLNNNARLNHDLDLIAGSGAHAFRWYPSQAGVEPVMGSGDYNWTEPDAVLAGAAARNLQVLLGVSARFDDHAYEPDRIDATGRYAAELAARYTPARVGDGTLLLGFEGHNEAFFTKVDTQPTAERYTACQAAIYEAIKGNAPTALVGTGGIIGSATHVVDLYAAGCKPFFDFLAFHPYTRPISAKQSKAIGHGGWAAMLDARQVMVWNGDAHKQIWVTEDGWNTGGKEAVTEQQQADYIKDAITRFRHHPWAGPFFVFCGWDVAGTDEGDSMGLYRADGTPKPALATFRELAKVA